MTRPSVLHITTIATSLELLLGPQLEGLNDAGFDVSAASADGPEVPALRTQRGIEHYHLENSTRSWHLPSDARLLRELITLFRRVKPDIVHTHNPKPGVIGRVAARASGVPIIVNTVHGLYAQPTDPLKRRIPVYSLERLAATCSHGELFQNRDDLETMGSLRVPNSRLHYLGNGIDLGAFGPGTSQERMSAREKLGFDDETIVVGCTARMVREKGIPELIEGFRAAKQQNHQLGLALIGDADNSRKDGIDYASRSAELSEEGINLLGWRDDVGHLYKGMDLFILPSHREGFPRSVMEAAASGLPVIATDIRGCRSAVNHGQTGFLIDVDSPDQICERIIELAGDGEMRADMAQAAIEKAHSDFNVDTQIAITAALYNTLLADAGLPQSNG